MKLKDFLNQEFEIKSQIVIKYFFECELKQTHEIQEIFTKAQKPRENYMTSEYQKYQRILTKYGDYIIKRIMNNIDENVYDIFLILLIDKNNEKGEINGNDI